MSRKSSGNSGKGGKPRSNGNGNTAVKLATVPPANPAIIQQMGQAWGGTSYGPNAPLLPYPGLQPLNGPRTFAYPIANNLNLVVRDNLTPFEILRQFADLYDVIGLCLQNWFDCAANLELDIVPVDGLLAEGETADKYADDIARYKEFFESPDKEHTLHEWLNAALRDLAVIDAVAIYPERTYAGDLNALILIDGSTIKPLLDDRGRTPQPPFYAYEQVVYGSPSEMWTTDDLLYLKEHHRTNSMFGFSRVENIIMRVNQALRKQNLDMAMFTDGNIPAGFVSPAADVGWSPEQLLTFQTMLDSLLSGNDALRSRMKMMPPGSVFTPTNPIAVEMDLDLFALKVTHASFGVMPSQSGFTDDVNRATADSQDDITYRRTLKPIANRFAKLITFVMRRYMNEKRFKAVWKGYEAQDDFSAQVADHVSLVSTGIERADLAAKALKLGDQGPAVPRFIMTKTGPFVVDDLANNAVRSAQVEQLTTPPQPPIAPAQQGQETVGTHDEGADSGAGGNAESDSASEPASESSSSQNSGESNQQGEDKKGKGKTVKRAAGDDEEEEQEEQQTGVMVAFFLDEQTANDLSLYGSEDPFDMHVTLGYLYDKADFSQQGLWDLRTLVESFSKRWQPFDGRVSGLARFAPSPSSDGMSPVVALVDMQQLAAMRSDLVLALDGEGFHVSKDFAYTPHITLSYLDADEVLPLQTIPQVPLLFDSVWLVIGEERIAFPLGGEPPAASENVLQPALADGGYTYHVTVEPDTQAVLRKARADLRKWRDFTVARLSGGKPLRPFVSEHIPTVLGQQIQRALESCTTAEDARLVFARVQDRHLLGSETDDGPFFG